MISTRKRNVKNGFSIVEAMVAAGILVFVALGAAVAVNALYTQQQQIVTQDTGNEFASSFLQHLLISNSCDQAFANLQLPAAGTELNLNFSTFKGHGERFTGNIAAGAQIDNTLYVGRIFAQRKADVAPEPVKVGNADYTRHVLQVVLRLERRLPNLPPKTLPDRILEVPVLTQGTTIVSCQDEGDPNEICAANGSTYDPVTKKCAPAASCEMFGTYIDTHCNGSRCGGEYNGPDRNNAITGTHSCPSTSCPMQAGQVRLTRSIQTGKKSWTNVTVTERFYVCMKCTGVPCSGPVEN